MNHDIVIKPNASLPASWFLQAIVIISFPSLLLALLLASMGFWMVLPFALLQILAIVYAFRNYRQRALWIERIYISDYLVVIERGTGRCEERIELPRHWARVQLEPPADRLKPNRLLLRTSMQTYEVASCLTDSERIGLKARLHALIGPACHTPNI